MTSIGRSYNHRKDQSWEADKIICQKTNSLATGETSKPYIIIHSVVLSEVSTLWIYHFDMFLTIGINHWILVDIGWYLNSYFTCLTHYFGENRTQLIQNLPANKDEARCGRLYKYTIMKDYYEHFAGLKFTQHESPKRIWRWSFGREAEPVRIYKQK